MADGVAGKLRILGAFALTINDLRAFYQFLFTVRWCGCGTCAICGL